MVIRSADYHRSELLPSAGGTGGFVVSIRQHPEPIFVPPGATILEAALAQGVDYPHGCRSANCGVCKTQLHAGEVGLAAHSALALDADERARGLILACRAVPSSDLAVSWLDPTDETAAHPRRRLACRVVALADLTHDIKRLQLAIDCGGPFAFSAGQYASLSFAALPGRDYSMASRPDEPLLEFHIRHLGGGSSAYVAETLRLGERVAVDGPFGSMWLRRNHAGPIIALAGGSGLAPIKAIVDTALCAGMRQPIHVYFGARDERDVYLEQHFLALAARHPNLRFVPVLSQPQGTTARRTGSPHEALARDIAEFDGAKAYLAGPPPLVEAASTLLAARGMRREDIHADAFYTEADKPALDAAAAL